MSFIFVILFFHTLPLYLLSERNNPGTGGSGQEAGSVSGSIKAPDSTRTGSIPIGRPADKSRNNGSASLNSPSVGLLFPFAAHCPLVVVAIAVVLHHTLVSA